MRLVCPNCAAQYEVADNAIPTAGRNVQCANCENTWFQDPASAGKPKPPQNRNQKRNLRKRKEQEAAASGRRNLRKKKPEDENSEGLSPEQILDAEAAQDDTQDTSPRAGISPQDGTTEKAPSVDQSVLDILRKEAELDAAARQSEPAAAEQNTPDQVNFTPDLSDNPAASTEVKVEGEVEEEQDLGKRARATRVRMKSKRERRQDGPTAPERSNEDTAVAPKRPSETTNRGQLPDVDELNSTLRSAKDKSRPADDTDVGRPRRKGAGRFGFYLAVLAALLGGAAYQFDDQIVQRLPQAENTMAAYVDLVNQGRTWLNGVAGSLKSAATNLMDQYL